MSEQPEEIKRWTARRKAEVVTDIIKGKTTASEVTIGATLLGDSQINRVEP